MPQNDAEVVTWMIGADRRSRGLSIVALLNAPRWLQDHGMSPDQLDARARLGNDSWAYWVRRGYDDNAGKTTAT